MKVLMYGWEFPPKISGGLGVACHAIVTELAKKKQHVTFVLPYELEVPKFSDYVDVIGCGLVSELLREKLKNGEINLTEFERALLNPYSSPGKISGINLSECGKDCAANLLRLINSNFNFSGHYGGDLYSQVYRFAELAGRMALTVEHDVIHVHDWLTILAGVNAKRISGKPLVMHVHATEVDRSGIDNINEKIFAIEKYGMKEVDQLIAVSGYTKSIVVKYYGINPDKITVVHNGTYISEFAGEPEQNKPLKTVLFLGRITHQKGPEFFIDVANKILQKRKDVHFVMAGSGDLFQEMVLKVAHLGIGKNVHFTGFLNRGLVDKILKLADVYVMPSVSEPFGLSCLEALSANVPVVISKQSGAAEALRNVSAVDFWDVDLMTDKILSLLDYSSLRDETLRNVLPEVKGLTWEKAASKIINVYNKSGDLKS